MSQLPLKSVYIFLHFFQSGVLSEATEVEKSYDGVPLVELQLGDIGRRLEQVEQLLNRMQFIEYLVSTIDVG